MSSHSIYARCRPSIAAMTLLIVLIVSPLRIGHAQQTFTPGIDVSGHLDVRAIERNASIGTNNFEIGQFMLEMSSDVSDRITAAVELAYVTKNKDVVLDEAYMDWSLYEWDGQPRTDPVGFTRVGAIVGQFDVPFGLDYRYYRSIDRLLVSVPMVVARTHRGWNDLGVQFYAETNWANWTVFAVNGFGTSQALRIDSYDDITPRLVAADEEINASLNLAEAYGSRFGLYVNDWVEFGTSFGSGYTENNDQTTQMFGFDASVDYDELQLKGEFISRRRNLVGERRTDLGYYLQGSYMIGRHFAAVRGDAFRPEDGPTDFSASLGTGLLVTRNAQLRAEYRWAQGSSNDTVLLQSAIVF